MASSVFSYSRATKPECCWSQGEKTLVKRNPMIHLPVENLSSRIHFPTGGTQADAGSPTYGMHPFPLIRFHAPA